MNENISLEIPDRQQQPKLVFTLQEAAAAIGRPYIALYRAVVRGDLKVLKGFGRLCITTDELNRFLTEQTVHVPKPNHRPRSKGFAEGQAGDEQSEKRLAD